MVSIPQGTIKRSVWAKNLFGIGGVSIPQGTIKRLTAEDLAGEVEEFQFHKVRLKDGLVMRSCYLADRFQFHKVRLKDNPPAWILAKCGCFNSTRYD